MSKMIICKECGLKKPHAAFGLCNACYKKQNLIICKECGKKKPHNAFGLCLNCYQKQKSKIICLKCGEEKPHHAKGLCKNCYGKQYRKQYKKQLIICKKCGLEKYLVGKGLCNVCYKKQQNLIKCSDCGELVVNGGKGLCRSCYRKQHETPKIVCNICGELKPHNGKGLCAACYSHKIGKSLPMSENKSCSNYLGVEINEKLLLKRFKNAKAMPFGHKGYDFTCDKDYKIDAKSSCLHFDKNYPNNKGHWYFTIHKNKIADYFCCIGYDNRDDLNVIKAWLIPSTAISKKGNIINNLGGLEIPKNNNKFWEQYEMDIDILDNCCTKMKK